MIQSFLKWLRKVVLKEKTKPCQGAKNVKFEKKRGPLGLFGLCLLSRSAQRSHCGSGLRGGQLGREIYLAHTNHPPLHYPPCLLPPFLSIQLVIILFSSDFSVALLLSPRPLLPSVVSHAIKRIAASACFCSSHLSLVKLLLGTMHGLLTPA